MKTLIYVAVLGALVYGAFRLSSHLVVGVYDSPEFGVRFNYPSTVAVTERQDKDTLELRRKDKPNDSSFVFVRKFTHAPGSELGYRLPGEFGQDIQNDQHAIYHATNGISFNWQGPKGLENAFAFESGDRDFVISTYGMPNGDTEAEFEAVLKSLVVTYE